MTEPVEALHAAFPHITDAWLAAVERARATNRAQRLYGFVEHSTVYVCERTTLLPLGAIGLAHCNRFGELTTRIPWVAETLAPLVEWLPRARTHAERQDWLRRIAAMRDAQD